MKRILAAAVVAALSSCATAPTDIAVTAEGAQLEPIYLAGNQPMPVKEQPIVIKADQVFPAKIEHDGAEIELLALKDGVLAYRVLSGFATDTTFLMDLPS
jgi:hypothetical protein